MTTLGLYLNTAGTAMSGKVQAWKTRFLQWWGGLTDKKKALVILVILAVILIGWALIRATVATPAAPTVKPAAPVFENGKINFAAGGGICANASTNPEAVSESATGINTEDGRHLAPIDFANAPGAESNSSCSP